jgi:hypothetical protein
VAHLLLAQTTQEQMARRALLLPLLASQTQDTLAKTVAHLLLAQQGISRLTQALPHAMLAQTTRLLEA